MANLVTPTEVLDGTGRSVNAAAITRAQAVIATVTGRDLDADPLPNYRARDLRLLGNAVMWQTAYLDEHPEVLAQLGNVKRASTNGNSIDYGEEGPAGSVVAPLAAVALRRLSWRRTRAIPLRPTRARWYEPQTIISDGADSEWRPLR